MNFAAIPRVFLAEIYDQAKREYPQECCGMVLGLAGAIGFSRLKPFRNVQNDYHAKDPVNFPRPARTAYFMDPAGLLALQKELHDYREEIRIIYHSHIDASAYFSAEDKRMALSGGEPLYPKTDYLVISVFNGMVREAALYRWDTGKKDFVLIETLKAAEIQ